MAVSGIKDSLKQQGVRLTRQRKILLDLIDQSGQHLDAERLFTLAREKDPKLNRVTVYRTLKLLKAGGLVDELDLMHHAGDQHYYETRLKQEHAHVICLRCGKIEEFFGDLLKKMREQIETHFGFEIVLSRTEVGGYCSHCQVLRAKELTEMAEPDPAVSSSTSSGRVQHPAEPLMPPPDGSPTAASRPPAIPERVPALAVTNPSGNRSRVIIDPVPFLIGRQGENNLVLRDNRISRSHARISVDNGSYVVEDLESRHGVFVNGQRVQRHLLKDGDRIDFGFPDSYRLAYTLDEDELNQFLGKISGPEGTGANNLSKLRSLVEVARALQSSLSTNDVLAAVVDAALSVTGAERGFLLLGKDDQLEVRVARDRRGVPLDTSDLGVPRSLINRALRTRRDLLSMTFDPLGADGIRPEMSVADLELRSVVCVPLIQVRTGSLQETVATSTHNTVGVLYMDSRQAAADLSSGNREILQTLALEASTILENARLLEEERAQAAPGGRAERRPDHPNRSAAE